jgi:hypothetical protein
MAQTMTQTLIHQEPIAIQHGLSGSLSAPDMLAPLAMPFLDFSRFCSI